MRRAGRAAAAVAALLLAAAMTVLMWPIHIDPFDGSALNPISSASSVRWHIAVLIDGGVGPSAAWSVVDHRREAALVLGAIAVAIVGVLLARRIPRLSRRAAVIVAGLALVVAAVVMTWPIRNAAVTGTAWLPTTVPVAWIGRPPTGASLDAWHGVAGFRRIVAASVCGVGLALAMVAREVFLRRERTGTGTLAEVG